MVNFAILPLLTLRASNWDFIATNSARSVLVIYYLSNWQTPNKQKTSKWTKTKLARMKVKLMPRWSKGCGRCSCVVINGGGQWPLMMTTWLMPLWETQILTKIPQRMLYIQEMQSTFPLNNHSVLSALSRCEDPKNLKQDYTNQYYAFCIAQILRFTCIMKIIIYLHFCWES